MKKNDLEEIRVAITRDEIVSIGHQEMIECRIVWRLRKAGIPVKGVFFLHGVEHGELHQFHDYPSGDMVYIWRNKETLDSDELKERD